MTPGDALAHGGCGCSQAWCNHCQTRWEGTSLQTTAAVGAKDQDARPRFQQNFCLKWLYHAFDLKHILVGFFTRHKRKVFHEELVCWITPWYKTRQCCRACKVCHRSFFVTMPAAPNLRKLRRKKELWFEITREHPSLDIWIVMPVGEALYPLQPICKCLASCRLLRRRALLPNPEIKTGC